MVKYFVVIVALVQHFSGSSQDNYVRPGLLEASGTISPSIMLNKDQSNNYISGFLSYRLDEKLSFRGDTYVYWKGLGSEDQFVKQSYRTYFGVFYHFTKNNWDKRIGFQPGITVMQSNLVKSDGSPYPVNTNASFAITAGTTYYVWKYFNFFANLTYVRSRLSGLEDGSHGTDELIFSAGLGFQVNTKR